MHFPIPIKAYEFFKPIGRHVWNIKGCALRSSRTWHPHEFGFLSSPSHANLSYGLDFHARLPPDPVLHEVIEVEEWHGNPRVLSIALTIIAHAAFFVGKWGMISWRTGSGNFLVQCWSPTSIVCLIIMPSAITFITFSSANAQSRNPKFYSKGKTLK